MLRFHPKPTHFRYQIGQNSQSIFGIYIVCDKLEHGNLNVSECRKVWRNQTETHNKTNDGWKKNTTQKTKDWATRTPLSIWGELICSGKVSCYCSTSGTRRAYIVKIQWKRKEGRDCDYDKQNISVVICDYDKQNISVVICDYDKQNISVVICDYDKQNISVVICDTDCPFSL
jgi:hypothetical protein